LKILLDHCVPKRLKQLLPGHDVKTTQQMGWAAFKNGELLTAAQSEFEVFLTVDRNIQYQQNLKERPIAIIVLVARNSRLETLSPLMPEVTAILPNVRPGELIAIGTNNS
jgi:predicted nuclease of predicted toxin-antitoxin system